MEDDTGVAARLAADAKIAAGQVRLMLDESVRTREAVDSLRVTLDGRKEILDEKINAIQTEVRHGLRDVRVLVEEVTSAHAELSDILVGKQGDNGLTARVLLLEKAKGKVAWEAVLAIVMMALAGLAVYLK